MDSVSLMYITIGGFIVFSLGLMTLLVAGKSIYYEIMRRILPKGVDVFMVNSSRQVSRYYKVPSDGVLTVNKKTYITNPDKLLSIRDPEVQEKINIGIIKQKANLEDRINELEDKIKGATALLEQTQDNGTREQINAHIILLQEKYGILQNKLKSNEQVYYNRQRGCFFFIEGDPIPKDFHELYTHMDSSAIDNVIARSLTKDPKAVKNMEKEIKMMKFLLIISLIGVGICAILLVTMKTDLTTMAAGMGVDLVL